MITWKKSVLFHPAKTGPGLESFVLDNILTGSLLKIALMPKGRPISLSAAVAISAQPMWEEMWLDLQPDFTDVIKWLTENGFHIEVDLNDFEFESSIH